MSCHDVQWVRNHFQHVSGGMAGSSRWQTVVANLLLLLLIMPVRLLYTRPKVPFVRGLHCALVPELLPVPRPRSGTSTGLCALRIPLETTCDIF